MINELWRLDPARFPKRIDPELSEPAMEHLQELTLRSGRPAESMGNRRCPGWGGLGFCFTKRNGELSMSAHSRCTHRRVSIR